MLKIPVCTFCEWPMNYFDNYKKNNTQEEDAKKKQFNDKLIQPRATW